MSKFSQQELNMFWTSFGVNKNGDVFRQHRNGITFYKDYKYLRQNGKNYLLNSSTGELFDNELNYYYQGQKYDFDGNVIAQVKNNKVVYTQDGTNQQYTSKTPENKIEVFDSDGNFAGYRDKNPKPKKKYNVKKGPKLKEKAVETVEKTTENTQKTAKKAVKSEAKTSKMATKSLNGSGNRAIKIVAAFATGIAVGKAISDNKHHRKKDDENSKTNLNNNQYLDNQYAMQMAKDISSYKYGKHMTGFVNS